MRRKLLLALCVIPLTITGCASLVATGVADRSPPDDGRTATEREMDARITNRINAALVADRRIPAMDVRVVSYRGIVTLSGVLPSAALRERAVAIARDTPGVRRVIDRIAVAAP